MRIWIQMGVRCRQCVNNGNFEDRKALSKALRREGVVKELTLNESRPPPHCLIVDTNNFSLAKLFELIPTQNIKMFRRPFLPGMLLRI
jgi:hypothetical protein